MAKESKSKTNYHILKNSGHDGTFLEGDERDEIQRNLYLVNEHVNVMTHHLNEVFYRQASGGILKKTSITDPNHTVNCHPRRKYVRKPDPKQRIQELDTKRIRG
jgi:hypothetical protein